MSHILIIEPSFSCLELLPTAKKLGHFVSVLTANKDDRIIPENYKKFIDNLIIDDTNNQTKVIENAKNENKQLKLNGIIPGSEYHVVIAAQTAHALNLPGHGIETVLALRNKYFMRNMLAKSNMRTPRFHLINSESDLQNAFELVGAPAVIKPTNLAGSLHVKKINSFSELQSAYANILKNDINEMEHNAQMGLMLEEYIQGKEYSIEGVINNGYIEIISITQKFLGDEPHFIEMAHIVEANLNDEKYEAISLYVKQIIETLKVNIGVFHLELRFDENGPVILEIAGRLPGDNICELIKLSKNIELPELMIQSHLQEKINLSSITKKYAGITFFYTPNNSYSTIENFNLLSQIKSYFRSEIIVQPNIDINHPGTFHGRVAFAIFLSESYDIIFQSICEAQKLVKIS